MKKHDYERLYNSEIKKKYLEQNYPGFRSRNILYYVFSNTSDIEKELNKDLFEMNEIELEKIFKTLNPSTENSSYNNVMRIFKYIKWCLDVGYTKKLLVNTNKNYREYAKQFVSKSKVFYTKEDLMKAFNNMKYLGDQALLLCIFEGIKGNEYSEITNIKLEHLYEKNGLYYIDLVGSEKEYRRKNFEISKELYTLLIKLGNTLEYEDLGGDFIKLKDAPYIFRKSKIGRKNVKNKNNYFSTKNKYYGEFFKNKNFTLTDIEMSGVMHYLNKLLEEKGERKVDNDILEKIAMKFNKTYVHSITKSDTPKYHQVRDMIDKDFFIENYGEFEYI